MARFLLAHAARADIAAVLETSRDRWGDAASDRYGELLAAAMHKIADDPEGPLTRARDEVLPNARSLHVKHAARGRRVKHPVHVIIFRKDPAGIVILHVLHERMDPLLHVTGR